MQDITWPLSKTNANIPWTSNTADSDFSNVEKSFLSNILGGQHETLVAYKVNTDLVFSGSVMILVDKNGRKLWKRRVCRFDGKIITFLRSKKTFVDTLMTSFVTGRYYVNDTSFVPMIDGPVLSTPKNHYDLLAANGNPVEAKYFQLPSYCLSIEDITHVSLLAKILEKISSSRNTSNETNQNTKFLKNIFVIHTKSFNFYLKFDSGLEFDSWLFTIMNSLRYLGRSMLHQQKDTGASSLISKGLKSKANEVFEEEFEDLKEDFQGERTPEVKESEDDTEITRGKKKRKPILGKNKSELILWEKHQATYLNGQENSYNHISLGNATEQAFKRVETTQDVNNTQNFKTKSESQEAIIAVLTAHLTNSYISGNENLKSVQARRASPSFYQENAISQNTTERVSTPSLEFDDNSSFRSFHQKDKKKTLHRQASQQGVLGYVSKDVEDSTPAKEMIMDPEIAQIYYQVASKLK